MRPIPTALQAHLDGGATTLCRCWLVRRRDGAAFGFTDHDAALAFDGVDFEAGAALAGSALESKIGLAADNVAVAGALASDAIAEADIARGRFDGASVDLFLVNWADPDQRALLYRGEIGEVSRSGAAFTAELLGLAERLNHPVGRAFSATCDAELGDPRCGVDLADPAFVLTGTVDQAPGPRLFTAAGLDAFAAGWFARGRLAWTSGANAGDAALVKAHGPRAGQQTIELWLPPADPIAPGDGFTLTAGCDKRAETCRDKFSNFINFRGFPHMPGDDAILAVPKRGDRNDGGSRYAG